MGRERARAPKIFAAAALAALALAGCGGAASSHPPSDLGFPVDGAFPAADLGFVADASFMDLLRVSLESPAPLSSLVDTAAHLDFNVLIDGAQKSDVESWLGVAPRGTSAAVTGAFIWTADTTRGAGAWKLEVIPSAALAAQTDYAVHLLDRRFTPAVPVVVTGFSTGSHPRVTGASLDSSGPQVALRFTFSEPMDASSVTAAASATVNGATVLGTAALDTTPTTAPCGPGQCFRINFPVGAAVSGKVTLAIAKGPTAAGGGAALDPASWDSPTAQADGTFLLSFDNVNFALNPSPSWTPTVN